MVSSSYLAGFLTEIAQGADLRTLPARCSPVRRPLPVPPHPHALARAFRFGPRAACCRFIIHSGRWLVGELVPRSALAPVRF